MDHKQINHYMISIKRGVPPDSFFYIKRYTMIINIYKSNLKFKIILN